MPAFDILFTVFGIPIILLFLSSINAPSFSPVSYKAFLRQPANIRVLAQTVEVSAVATGICIIIGYPTAYLITAASKGLRTVLVVLVVIPYLTSLLVRTYAWIVILGDRGLINNFLLDLGVISSPLPLIYNRMAVYIGMVHIMLTLILPLISVMLGIDNSDGCSAQYGGAPLCRLLARFFPAQSAGGTQRRAHRFRALPRFLHHACGSRRIA